MARDWPATLRDASFRGVPFFVDKDDIGTGKKLVIHEFVNSDEPYVEEFGTKAMLNLGGKTSAWDRTVPANNSYSC